MSEEYRPGEKVKVKMVDYDDAGKIMGELTWVNYGFTNEQSNEFSRGVIKALLDYTEVLAAKKAERR